MQAQSADGVLHEFPDGTDPSVVDRVMKGYAQTQAPTDPAAEAQNARNAAARQMPRPGRDVPQYTRDAPTSTWEDVRDTVGRIAPKANDRIAETVGRALDVIPYYADKAMGGEGVHPVENTYKKYFGSAGLPPPASTAQEYADAGGRMLGENLPFMAGTSILSKGVRLATDAAPTIANAAKGGFNSLMDAVATKPVGTLAGETGASIESGAIGEGMRQHAQDEGYGPTGQAAYETLGQMGGPTAMFAYPSVLAGKVVGKVAGPAVRAARSGIGTIAEALPSEYVPEGIADRLKNIAGATQRERAAAANTTVNKELSNVLAKPEAQAGVAEAQRLESEIPGFKPGLARATNDPVLLNTQKELDAQSTGNELRQSQEAHDQSGQSLRNKFEALAPKTVENPQDVVHGAEATRVKSLEDMNKLEQDRVVAQQGQVQKNLRAAGEALPDAERADQGAKFRDIHDKAYQASSDKTTELRNNIAAPDTPVVMKPGKPAVTDEYLPSVPIEPEVPPVTKTVKQVLDRRGEINQETRLIASAPGRSVEDMKQMGRLQDERQNLDSKINEINLPGMKEYREYYRDEHVPRFEEGAGRDVGRYDRFGYDKNKVPDEKVLEQFGGPNNISAARQFTATHGQNPEAVQLMADHQLGRLKKEAIDPATGAIREGGVEKFLTKNKELLDALPPEVRAAVSARNPDQLYQKLGELTQRQRGLAEEKVTSSLGKSPEKTLDAALNDWQVMRDLKKTVSGNQEHEAALTRAVMDRAPDPADAKKFGAWLDGHDRVLRQVLTPQHLADLKTIAKAAEMHNRLPRPSGAVELPKSIAGALGDKTGVTVPSAVGSGLAVARGRTSPFTEVPMQAIKLWNKQKTLAVNAAWREALSNPDMARTIGAVMRGKQATPMQISKMHTYLVASGLLPSNADNEQK